MQTTLSAVPARSLPLYGVLGAVLISTTGNAVTQLAVPWYVLTTTGSPARTGLAAFFGALPLVLGAFFGGTVADRLGFKRMSLLADVASGVSIALIPLLAATVGLPFWALLLLVFSGALFDTSGVTARTALLVDLARTARMRLERVNSMEEVALNVPLLIGPPLAGALIAVLEPTQVLWIDAASFAVSAVVVAALVNVPGRAPREEGVAVGYGRELVEGMRFVARDRVMLLLVVLTGLMGMLVAPLPSVLMPVYMSETYGSALALGLLIAAVGVGALVGVLLYAAVGHRLPRRPLVVLAPLGLGVTAIVLATLPPFGIIVAAALVGGTAYGPFSPLLTTVAAERTPEEMRGRVFGILTAITAVAVPVGVLLVGFGLQALGVRSMIGVIAVGFLALALCAAFTPALHDLRAGAADKVT